MIDWGEGEYERTAAELMPVAEHVVAMAGIGPRRRVLDLGCGTGNAALLAARAGARVTALDPSERLLDVTRARLAKEGLEVETVASTAERLPFSDASFDVVLSIFAVIFTPDPEAAAREIVRVLEPRGRALITTWRPVGAMHETFKVVGAALADLTPDRAGEPFAWGDEDPLRALFEAAGGRVAIEEGRVAFTAASPEERFDEGGRSHPMGMAARRALEQAGRADEVREQALAVLRAHNEDPAAFRSTSRYLVATIST